MIECMDNKYGRIECVFIQGGACCHTSKESVKWLETQCKFIKKWPANRDKTSIDERASGKN